MPKPTLSTTQALSRAADLARAGDMGGAAALYRKVLGVFPNHRAAKAGLAALGPPAPGGARAELEGLQSLLMANRFAEAQARAQSMLPRFPQVAFVPNTLGIALAQLGRPEEAVTAFRRALTIDRGYAPAYVNLASALRQLWHYDEARAVCEAGLKIAPGSAELHALLGLSLDDLGQTDPALDSLKAALRLRPDSLVAHDGICRLLERASRIDELQDAVAAAEQACGANPTILFRKAQLAFRTGDPEQTRAILTPMDVATLSADLRPLRDEILGKAYDRLGDPDNAFAHFAAMNDHARARLQDPDPDQNAFWRMMGRKLEAFPRGAAAPWQPVTGLPEIKAAFLVGFPRSGTTLLDTVLRGHPGLSVAEEPPTIARMKNALGAEAEMPGLAELTPARIAEIRDRYKAEFEAFTGTPVGERTLIDKMPLNLAEADVINRLFPDAGFILALRHPCDCVLSCVMQRFRPNAAMDNFLTLEQAARSYDRAMTLWLRLEETLGLTVTTVRYEDLISDVGAATAPVFRMLGLDPGAADADHIATAQARGRIQTPSYRQITQPIYHHARGRWERYASQMAPVLPILAPWIAKWGYDAPLPDLSTEE